ncbi:transcriptional regulator family: Fungal Specific TF [Penicillium roqueforti]|uniref:Zn(2)-C6 fungal-type DNA-binding domain n=1 Tax=Penicillium roqueforti (strain FM164) TaxID=1365484 RepID=W6Q9Y7_PENRF|nr:transcriptional regulator family: Fungal Specific TF [Penicillium roqueforti]CDM33225.1 Zn(2)-C6 fungal-type DNA-binding domain [Penicillium roqueforti FM164]KAF9240545.1 transcriptional regulator family: Fungal Specific TF [Penicillium roqueforti]KAI1830760.1 transcriptional regulator family: Fungal Specific TF [Penicillium roqueforti]KAI2674491.1 transcriptional regulator family: Fungal Specific TF [Penicillium roqueforti]KAI2683848.1 transcriptional regulator family: Fungal Specific TF [
MEVLPKKGKKACTMCRQQKAKCDVWRDETKACSRCRDRNLECTIDDSFTREHKRRRYMALEHENKRWRQQLQSSQQLNSDSVPIALPTATTELGVPAVLKSDGQVDDSQGLPLPYPQYPLAPASSTSGVMMGGDDPTKPRSLKSLTVTGAEIDDLYQLFFHHYASFLPILDAQTKPNAYYAQSPFLFWAVIGVASRSYSRNPTLQTALAQEVTEMAFLSVMSTCAPWHIIQGLLLLLTWPFPKENRPDVTFPLSGMLLHVAMQNGFHIPMSSHEFSRAKIPAPSELDMVRRSELWAHCVLVYQRSCVIKGQSPQNLFSLAQDTIQRQVLFDKIAPDLVQKLKCQDVVGRCSEAVMENGVRAMSLDQELALDILLRKYEGEVDDIALQAVDDERYHILLCRMSIHIFHFYKNQTLVSSGCLPRLIATACNLIDYVQAFADRMGALFMAPIQISFGLLLASISLLRILKSEYASSGLDTSRAQASFFAAINLAKQISTDRSDIAAKTITLLTQLWNSSKAFRKSDGSEYTVLRIRSRLILSQILDAVWWWRDEYDPNARMKMQALESVDGPSRTNMLPGIEAGRAMTGTDPAREPAGGITQNLGHLQGEFEINEDYFTNFEWLSDEIFSFPPDSLLATNLP